MAPQQSVDDEAKRQQLLQAGKVHPEGAALLTQQQEWVDSACLGRYLRARKGHVSKAAKMLLSTLQWRAGLHLAHPLRIEEFEPEIKSGKIYVCGNDPAGRSILVTRKKSDAFKPGDFDHYLRHLVFTLETACMNMQKGQEAWVWIMDMAGMTRANSPPLNVSLATLRVMADHFPERLCRCFFVDAPAVFSYLWAALSPFIDPVTKQKIVFVKSAEWRPKMERMQQQQQQQQQQQTAASGSGAEADPCQPGADELDFSRYWQVYNTPYNETSYRQLLDRVGWDNAKEAP